MMHGFWGIDPVVGWLLLIVFWTIILGMIFWGIRLLTTSNHSALNIVQERYVMGEISREEYLELVKDLKKI